MIARISTGFLHLANFRRGNLWLAVAALGFCAACRSTPPPEVEVNVEWLEALKASSLEQVPWRLETPRAGAPGRADGPVLLSGDRLLFSIDLRKGEDSERSYLAMEVVGPAMRDGAPLMHTFSITQDGVRNKIESALFDVRLELFDRSGGLIKTSQVLLGEGVAQNHLEPCEEFESLAQGLGLPIEALREDSPELQARMAPVQAAMGRSVHSLVSLFGLAQEDDLLSDLLWDVVDKPSVFSVLARFGVEVNLNPAYHKSALLPEAPYGVLVPGPYRILPMSILLNGREALQLDFLIVPPKPPWSMTGGIIAFEGRHPSKDVRILARLIDARWSGHAVDG